MQALVERVKQDQAKVLENTGEEMGKRAAIGGDRSVTLSKNLAEGLAESWFCVADQLRDFVAKRDTTDGLRIFREFGQFKAAELAIAEPCGVPDFVNVMVLSGHPEYRDRLYPTASKILRCADGREGLVKSSMRGRQTGRPAGR